MHKDILSFYNSDRSFYINNKIYEDHTSMPNNHFHKFYEIYYLLSGERYYFIKDRTYLIKKGDLVLINKNDLHKTYDAGSSEHQRILINFSESFITNMSNQSDDILKTLFLENSPVSSFTIDEQLHIENLLMKITSEIEHKYSGYEFYLQGIFFQLLVVFLRYRENKIRTKHEELNPMHSKIFQIVKFINNNYHEPLSLPYISERFYISPYYLSRIFKETTGFTFVEYVNSIRIQQAQRLLSETKLNVTIIAEKTGFDSTAHFGRVFKSITGLSPLNYKKSLICK